MRALVAYRSRSGNTRKVAEAIYEALDCEKEIRPVDEVVDIGGYDLSFLGFPMERFGPDPKTVGFLRQQCQEGRDVALFVTHAAPEDAAELPGWLEGFRNAAAGANILGMFDCQGELARCIKFFMSIMPNREIRAMAKRDNSQGQPDEMRLDRARAFAREMLQAKVDGASPAGSASTNNGPCASGALWPEKAVYRGVLEPVGQLDLTLTSASAGATGIAPQFPARRNQDHDARRAS